MFNAIASIFWSLVKLIRFALLMILFFYLIVLIGYLTLCYFAFQNGNV